MGRGTPKNRKHGTADFEEIDQLLGDVNAKNTQNNPRLLKRCSN
jgi:hypothetical protein